MSPRSDKSWGAFKPAGSSHDVAPKPSRPQLMRGRLMALVAILRPEGAA